jgi:DNA-directed RNA polymerase specialized sigma24 family protein
MTEPSQPPVSPGPRAELLYYFCRLQLPGINLSSGACAGHLQRTYQLFHKKQTVPVAWDNYLDNLYPLDWFVASACLDGNGRAWEQLFASRAGRSDCLLVDALRARAARLYPRDDERQESAVQEFWSQLYAPENEGSLPVLARYDGQRPLVPWLIRVFQNWHVSQLRRHNHEQPLLDDDHHALPVTEAEIDTRWRELFAVGVHDWLADRDEGELLLLGLRLRFHLSQREVAQLLKVHEGTISRRADQLSQRCLEFLSDRLTAAGWTGDNVFEYVRTEMGSLLLDHPSLSVDHLAQALARKGKPVPALPPG